MEAKWREGLPSDYVAPDETIHDRRADRDDPDAAPRGTRSSGGDAQALEAAIDRLPLRHTIGYEPNASRPGSRPASAPNFGKRSSSTADETQIDDAISGEPKPRPVDSSVEVLRTASGEHPPSGSTTTPENAPGGSGMSPDFVLRGVLGAGGQAEIWRAFQPGLDREIALKLLPPDGTPHQAARFLQEAYTSAALDHPNIIPVYELNRGTGYQGRETAQLAMKLVRGRGWNEILATDRDEAEGGTLNESYLQRHLTILISVCNAVAYAHSKQIIHRDLKPKQVVIGEFGEVYLLDWGLALSLSEDVPTIAEHRIPKFRTRATAANRSGTPAYMAPEQTTDSTAQLGFATDVYLLGATLYEIVAGRAPHGGDTATAAFHRAQSNAIEPLREDTPEELRATIERAMSTDPAERHETVTEFREEIEAYLSGAGRIRESKDLSKIAREWFRDRGADGGYDVFVDLEKLISRALQLWPANVRARELRQQVYDRYAESALENGDLQLARSLVPMLVDEERRVSLVAQIVSAEERSKKLDRRRRLLEIASAALAVSLLYAMLVGSTLYTEGKADAKRAAEQSEQAAMFRGINELRDAELRLVRQLQVALPDPDRLDLSDVHSQADPNAIERLVDTRNQLTARRAEIARDPNARTYLGEPSFELMLADANLELYRSVRTAEVLTAYRLFESAHLRRREDPDALIGMGVSAARAGFPTSAALHLGEAVERVGDVYGKRSREYAEVLSLEAAAWQQLGNERPDYVELYEESLAILEPEWGRLSMEIAERWQELGNSERAMSYASPTLELFRRIDSEELHALRSRALLETGGILTGEGRYREALELVEEGNDLITAHRGDEAVESSDALLQRAVLERRLALYVESEKHLREALELRRNHYGETDPRVGEILDSLSSTLTMVERFDEAEKYSHEAIRLMTDAYTERHPKTVQAINTLALLYEHTERPDLATPLLRRSLELHKAIYGDVHPTIVGTHNNIAFNLDSLDLYDEASEHYKQALEVAEQVFQPDHPHLGAIYSNYASNLAMRGLMEEALELMNKSLVIKRQSLGPEHPSILTLHNNMAYVAASQGKDDVALAHYVRTLSGYRTLVGDNHRGTALMFTNVGWMLYKLDRFDESATILGYCLRLVIGAMGESDAHVFSTARRLLRATAAAGERAGTQADRDRRAQQVIRLSHWLQQNRVACIGESNAETIIESDISMAECFTSAVLSLEPPRTGLARHQTLRAMALADLIDLPATHAMRVRFLDPRAAQFGIAVSGDDARAIGNAPDELKQAIQSDERLDDVVLGGWLDTVAPTVDWKAEFAGMQLDASDLFAPEAPAAERERVDEIVARLLDEAEALGVGVVAKPADAATSEVAE